ncbi:MAG TPA: 2-C-methyl-D-erythritol 2,4-cyclodiphosphate synthase [Elusimicrobia bacterium]|nr:MAG: 2-C-methyl-D-erythritol 2,4-cyclodiphosphate synthase [Elusimicrobia bacterium RIFOXYA12_FULL_49_49]OGS09492.1 MAG: 2-C-methyl-D-erythritol 2,4-cyclodiphosphate synthase [Elusimicrobia bacterium RIFOXYA1_FULL_47_7]OGS10629.1 MAG: 2-C-methyl-D-erythritol 2,4-cyclodiphosphate synthase [Elusimicrobia bacterium RIFOXYB1_FULL_48_9]OGS15862.1 MAG: 2-C-methyl-D-erythritol 2,4-cyclodiphosphate synthase [Elusimicrobia bacterium RIFOXYA2_FULL_47_53]OGS27156.1 MAG: 2-C-methyl-D-erythritol 2,4-cycl
MFVGLGYDVHAFKKGRVLVLGGVKFKYPLGLDGHSDADVVIHALMDAILGAAGKSDIGTYFPNTSASYKGISSLELLKKVAAIIKKDSLKINNVDISVIAEKPKISASVSRMKTRIAGALGIKPQRVGIKATTNEGMGFIGRGEGIAAMAVASLSGIE